VTITHFGGVAEVCGVEDDPISPEAILQAAATLLAGYITNPRATPETWADSEKTFGQHCLEDARAIAKLITEGGEDDG
jgi:hypothetical protein